MYCTRCGSKIDSGEFFCPYCGHPTENPAAEREEEPTLERTIERPAAMPVSAAQMRASSRTTAYRDPNDVSHPFEEQYGSRYGASSYRNRNSERNRSRGIIAALTVALALSLAIVAVLLVPRVFGGRDRTVEATGQAAQVETATQETEAAAEETTQVEEEPQAEAEPATETEAEPATEAEPEEEPQEEAATPVSDGSFVLPESSTRLYSAEELEGLSTEQLEIARNEIYARHGRGFNSASMRAYFEAQDWYEQRYTAEEFDALSPSPLSQVEQANVNTILQVENAR